MSVWAAGGDGAEAESSRNTGWRADWRPGAGNHWTQEKRRWAGAALTHWRSPASPAGQCFSLHTSQDNTPHSEAFLCSPALYQVYSSVCCPPEVKSWTNININTDLLNTDILDKALICLKEKVNKQLKKIHISKQYRCEFICEVYISRLKGASLFRTLHPQQ